jgi:hypothetical protein
MKVQGFQPAAFLYQPFHDKPGTSPVPELFEHIDPVYFKAVRVPGAAGDTYQLRPGKCGEEPVVFGICGLPAVMNPEFLLGAAHFIRGKFPDHDLICGRVSYNRMPEYREVLPDPVKNSWMMGDELPGLPSGKCIERKQGGVFPGVFRLYSWWQCGRIRILPA